MPDLGAPELIIIAIVVLVLFGSAKLPQAARSLGRSLRIFKSETKGLISDDDASKSQAQAQAQPQDMREQAARLREQAARLEQQAGGQQQLSAPASDPAISGVPLQHTERGNQS